MARDIKPVNRRTGRLIAALLGVGLFIVLKIVLHLSFPLSLIPALISYGLVQNVLNPHKRVGRVQVDYSRFDAGKRQILTEASEHLSGMDSVLRQIRTADIRTRGRKILETGNRIIEYVTKYPEKISIARRFFNYYLETASSILKRYLDIQQTRIDTEETRKMVSRTIQALEILETAFEKQFAKLMVDEIMDIETDIRLLETTLKMEG